MPLVTRSSFSQGGGRSSLVPFMGCMSSRSSQANGNASSSSSSSRARHAWDVVIQYYRLKHGHEFNSAPQRKLSQSFGLDLSSEGAGGGGGSSAGNRTSLLAAVGQILATHGPYKRSPDAHFKAFVCAGLK